MNKDDIIRMAREADLARRDDMTQFDSFMFALPDRLERFAALVAAAEREACAKDCETLLPSQRIYDRRFYDAVGECVLTIRARGEK